MTSQTVELHLGILTADMTIGIVTVQEPIGDILVEGDVTNIPLSEVLMTTDFLIEGSWRVEERDFVWFSQTCTDTAAIEFLEWLRRRESCQITQASVDFWRLFDHSTTSLINNPGGFQVLHTDRDHQRGMREV